MSDTPVALVPDPFRPGQFVRETLATTPPSERFAVSVDRGFAAMSARHGSES